MFIIKNCAYLVVLFVFADHRRISGESNDIASYRSKRQTGRKCNNNQFRCRNGQCVSQNVLCNGIRNCLDGSDERWEVCESQYPNSCLIPSHVTAENFALNCGSNISPKIFQSIDGDRVEEFTLISYIFQVKTLYRGQVQSVCLKGKWTPPLPDISNTCPPISYSKNVQIKCYLNNVTVDCATSHTIGTIVKPQCAENFVPNSREVVCEVNGKWSTEKVECLACGIVADKTPSFQYPWTIGFYRIEPPRYLGAGTILSPNVIVTTANRIDYYVSDFKNHPENYVVQVGKKVLTVYEEDYKHIRTYTIKNIIVHEDYDDSKETNDVAILVLSNDIIYNSAVYPLCFDSDESKYQSLIKNSTEGEIVIATYKDNEHNKLLKNFPKKRILVSAKLPYTKSNRCIDLANSTSTTRMLEDGTLICADYRRVAGEIQGVLWDRGIGFFVRTNNNTHLLHGMLKDVTSFYKALYFFYFVDASKHYKWLSNHLEQLKKPKNQSQDEISTEMIEKRVFTHDSLQINCTEGDINTRFTDGCLLPRKNLHHIDYEAKCLDNIFQGYCNRSIENAPVPQLTRLYHSCKFDYAAESVEVLESVCLKGKWLPPIGQCQRVCRLPKLENLKIKCTFGGEDVSCDRDPVVNMEVFTSCPPEYKLNSTTPTGSIFCKEDGHWSRSFPECIPICGRSSKTKITPTIHNGDNVTLGEFPWHAAVYDKTQKNWLICGATIVSPNALISAAHCFYDRQTNSYKNAANFEIGVGKVSKDYDTRDSEVTRYYQVEKLIFDNFSGLNLRYQRDIVIVVLKEKIALNPQVGPVCLYENSNIPIATGTKLDVPGWGIDETSRQSDVLKVAHLPFINYNDCSRIATSTILDYLSTDKFCTGFVDDTSLDRGDSGGGLVHLSSTTNFYYLIGIVSIKASDNGTMSLSTNVLEYLPWIRRQLENI